MEVVVVVGKGCVSQDICSSAHPYSQAVTARTPSYKNVEQILLNRQTIFILEPESASTFSSGLMNHFMYNISNHNHTVPSRRYICNACPQCKLLE